MNKSIPELIAFLKHALRGSHFQEVQDILVEREERAKLEIEKLRIENGALRKKCEVLHLECGDAFSVTSGDKNGAVEKERSAEEIYDQLVGEIVGGKERDEVGKLKRENEELKRKNAGLSKLILDCVENYVEWNNKFSSLQRDVTKLKILEVVGLDGIGKNRSGETRENRGNFMQNDHSGLSCGNVRRVLDFGVGENDPVVMIPAKEKLAEILVDQGSGIVPLKRALDVIDIDDDLTRGSCDGNLASQKPIDGKHYNQNSASQGWKRKGYSFTNVLDLGKNSNPTSRVHRVDSKIDGQNVNKGEELTQKVRSPLKASSSSTSTPGDSDAQKAVAKSKRDVLGLRQCVERNVKQRQLSEQLKRSVLGIDSQTDGQNVNTDEESTQKVRSPPKVSSSSTSTPRVSDAEKVVAKSKQDLLGLRLCVERNVKQRQLSEQLHRSVSGIAQKYDSKGSRDIDLSADNPKRKRHWKFFADMSADLTIDEVCMSAVCTLYRQQKKSPCECTGGSIRWGFSSNYLERGIQLGEFLTNGDPQCRLRKTAKELQSQFRKGIEDCRDIAREHAKQLFEIYQERLDAFYPDA